MQRLTRQRNAVFSAFSDAGRVLTAPEILEHAREIVPEISLSTVYRQVSLLLADGEIAKVELPGEPARYEVACKPAAHRHAHHDGEEADTITTTSIARAASRCSCCMRARARWTTSRPRASR
jgi:Fur family ferric uptake transcriptional regulator